MHASAASFTHRCKTLDPHRPTQHACFAQEADAEEEGEGGRRQRARDVRRDARAAEREMAANRMRKKDVSGKHFLAVIHALLALSMVLGSMTHKSPSLKFQACLQRLLLMVPCLFTCSCPRRRCEWRDCMGVA